jgi:hypothetical protein
MSSIATSSPKGRAAALVTVLVAAMCAAPTSDAAPRINAPRFASTVPFTEAAVGWFGTVGPQQNYADVRVAHTDTELWVTFSVADQWLWVDNAASRTPASLENWDAATLLLDTSNASSPAPTAASYRFVASLNWSRPRTDYQAVYSGASGTWALGSAASFTTESSWRGDSPNTTGVLGADRGWLITFHVPYAAVGQAGPPAPGTTWRMSLAVHDKDSSAGAATRTAWPAAATRDQPVSWGELGFGLRTFVPPAATSPQTYTIRHGLDGQVVSDAMVGGGSTCGTSDYFNTSGSLNYAGSTTLVVQNQRDIADWPCFSKTLIDFPLDRLPAGRAVVSATLTVYQFGGSDPTQAFRSLVQVFTLDGSWSEGTVTWNNAPPFVENVSRSWVDVIPSQLPWPGAARTWDLSWAAGQAYRLGLPVLRLALYSADGGYHSGKYFTSSDTGEWNAVGRPTLQIVLGDAPAAPLPPTNVHVVP